MPGSLLRAGYPLSRARLRSLPGAMPGSNLYDFLDYQTVDAVRLFDDFLGDTINLDLYAVANSGGTGAVNFAVPATQLVGGAIRGQTGTDDNGSISLIGPLAFKGDLNCGMEARFKVDVITGLNFEIGWLSGVPGSNAGFITDIDTPAVTGSLDGAVLSMDTDQTLTTLGFVTAGTTAGQDAAKTNISSPTTPTAATYMTARVELRTNKAYCYINGVLVASNDSDADGNVEGGTLVAPWIYVRTRNTTTKVFDVDYLHAWQDRT